VSTTILNSTILGSVFVFGDFSSIKMFFLSMESYFCWFHSSRLIESCHSPTVYVYLALDLFLYIILNVIEKLAADVMLSRALFPFSSSLNSLALILYRLCPTPLIWLRKIIDLNTNKLLILFS
jgi:hypothetical protein